MQLTVPRTTIPTWIGDLELDDGADVALVEDLDLADADEDAAELLILDDDADDEDAAELSLADDRR